MCVQVAKVYAFLATGFEEVEALAVIDLLRRAAVEVDMISVTGDLRVTGAHNIEIKADKLFEEADFKNIDLLFLPGGMPGTHNLDTHEGLLEKIIEFDKEEKYIAAICAAPSVFGHLGILKDRYATCYPGFEKELIGAKVTNDKVVVDGHIITARGMGTAIDLGLQLISILVDEKTAEEKAKGICYTD